VRDLSIDVEGPVLAARCPMRVGYFERRGTVDFLHNEYLIVAGVQQQVSHRFSFKTEILLNYDMPLAASRWSALTKEQSTIRWRTFHEIVDIVYYIVFQRKIQIFGRGIFATSACAGAF
jgi:hypothetical protein